MNSPCLTILSVCLTRTPIDPGEGLFGFSNFLSGLALLALVFTQSDPLYRFRVAVAPIPVGALTLAVILLVGSASLLTDLWFALGWYSLPWGVPKAAIQATLGAVVFLTVILWLTFAFARPPHFGRSNARKFIEEVIRALASGGERRPAVIAQEIRRSAANIITACKPASPPQGNPPGRPIPDETRYAFDLLRLIADRRFCREVVATSPGTAMALMDIAARQQVYFAPLGNFAQNITIEAIKNHDSGLYHENRIGPSGLMGHIQPFTRAMYGCYELIEQSATSMSSALDLHYRDTDGMTADEWEAYGRAVTTTTADYLKIERQFFESTVLNRAIEHIVESTRGLYRIDGASEWRSIREESEKLSSALRVINDIVSQIDAGPNRPTRRYVRTGNRKYWQRDIVDDLCDALVEILANTSSVVGPADTAWSIQYNVLWSGIDSFGQQSETWKVIHSRLTRLIIHELRDMRKYADFRSIRIIGLLLNVLGVVEQPRSTLHNDFALLRRYTIRLVRKIYLKVVAEQPHVAEAALVGGITFDAQSKRLVKTYARGLRSEPPREYLDLEEWTPPISLSNASVVTPHS